MWGENDPSLSYGLIRAASSLGIAEAGGAGANITQIPLKLFLDVFPAVVPKN